MVSLYTLGNLGFSQFSWLTGFSSFLVTPLRWLCFHLCSFVCWFVCVWARITRNYWTEFLQTLRLAPWYEVCRQSGGGLVLTEQEIRRSRRSRDLLISCFLLRCSWIKAKPPEKVWTQFSGVLSEVMCEIWFSLIGCKETDGPWWRYELYWPAIVVAYSWEFQ